MAVKRKPTNTEQDEQKIEAFISGGGSEPETPSPTSESPKSVGEFQDDEIKKVQLRLPQSLMDSIDQVLAQRRPKPSRHQWILEAIYEKLEREEISDQL